MYGNNLQLAFILTNTLSSVCKKTLKATYFFVSPLLWLETFFHPGYL